MILTQGDLFPIFYFKSVVIHFPTILALGSNHTKIMLPGYFVCGSAEKSDFILDTDLDKNLFSLIVDFAFLLKIYHLISSLNNFYGAYIFL